MNKLALTSILQEAEPVLYINYQDASKHTVINVVRSEMFLFYEGYMTRKYILWFKEIHFPPYITITLSHTVMIRCSTPVYIQII